MAEGRMTVGADGTVDVELRATEAGEDLRDVVGRRFVCTAVRPWSGRREDAPHGVSHADAVQRDGMWSCPNCGASWGADDG